jgi:hypothetical protein
MQHKTFEEILAAANITAEDFAKSIANDTTDEAAYKKLKLIAKVANAGWEPNWDNGNEYKHYPYFDMENGFSFYYVGDWYSRSSVGSRLCFRNEEDAEAAATNFLDIYRDYFVISK